MQEDSYAKLKYGGTAGQDSIIIDRVAELAGLRGVSMTEISYLEEAYVPHRLVGVMAQNTQASAKESHVWSTGNQKI